MSERAGQLVERMRREVAEGATAVEEEMVRHAKLLETDVSWEQQRSCWVVSTEGRPAHEWSS